MEERIDRDDRKVLAEYGRTMLAVQLFELNLLGLVQMNQPEPPEDVDFGEAWKQVEPLFRKTAGQLRKELEKQGSVPDDLLEELQVAVNTRNTLAHSFLLTYRMDKLVNRRARHDAIETLRIARGKFREVGGRLDALTSERAKERGWDLDDVGLSEEEFRQILAADDGEPETTP
jgi:hypothetical protein